jgi:hypothetical protein
MSFTVDLVEGKVPVSQPDDFLNLDIDYEQSPSTAVTEILGIKDNRIRPVASSLFAWNSRKTVYLYNTEKTVLSAWSTGGVFTIVAENSVRIGQSAAASKPSYFQVQCKQGEKLLMYLGYNTFTKHVRTINGSGDQFYSDGFVLYSSRRNKRAITAITGTQELIDAIEVKDYTVAGKPRIGAIAEDMPDKFIDTSFDEDGKEIKGIDVSSVLFALLDVVQQLKGEVRAMKTVLAAAGLKV